MAGPQERFTIDVPGRRAVSGAYARPAKPFATLVVAHGAGSGMDHPFLVGFTRAISEQGVATLRFNFPYMEAGRRGTDTAPVAIAAWRAVFEAASDRAAAGEPVWAGGKSFGGRMASMAVAEGMPAAGLIFLGYPLHPPGKPERVRDEHLYGIKVPMLFLHGTGDPFATAAVLTPVLARLGDRATLHSIEGGGHSLELSRRDDPREVGASMAPVVAGFMREHSAEGR
jgi:predicted alpha/beta-hydrolase family hydrolase